MQSAAWPSALCIKLGCRLSAAVPKGLLTLPASLPPEYNKQGPSTSMHSAPGPVWAVHQTARGGDPSTPRDLWLILFSCCAQCPGAKPLSRPQLP